MHWRVLVEMVRRPADSPAVVRARGGANAINPVAALLADLAPDGSWLTDAPLWQDFNGSGWRLLAAVQMGADPTDPRLHAGAEALLETAPGEGGFAIHLDQAPVSWLTARTLHALAELGWCHHARFQEGLAWLDEAAPRSQAGGWERDDDECEVTPVALLTALTACGESRRISLSNRARQSIVRQLDAGNLRGRKLGYPNFDRTDGCEALWALARADAGLDSKIIPALSALQEQQIEGGRWCRETATPGALLSGEIGPSRWLTLRAAVALLHYAVEAKLPRMYPQKPKS